MAANYTPLSAIPNMVSSTRNTFFSGKTLPYSFRMHQLKQLRKMVQDNAKEFIIAGQKDIYKRSDVELQREEVDGALEQINLLIDNLSTYMKRKYVGTDKEMGYGEFHYSPRGNVLIIGPWNFALNLCSVPLAGAIAAGCTAILKPSEVSPAIAVLLAKLIPLYLDNTCYKVVLGAVAETTLLLKHQFDLIFYTGAPAVGKIVAQAAAKFLTPCILEMGGKNPVIVDDTVDIDKVAEQLVLGRFAINCGQNCTSPDFVIINKNLQNKLISAMKKQIPSVLGNDLRNTPEFCRVINKRHFNRLSNIILESDKSDIAIGGELDESELFISPTVIKDCNEHCRFMKEESFGPIIGIYPVNNVETDALPIIQSKPKPLISFVFSNNKQFVNKIIERTDSGAVTVNSITDHFAFPGFPFGGSGNSGWGSYHGKYTFLAFSHEKPVLTAKL